MRSFTNMWKSIGELDLRPIQKAAEKPVLLAVAGGPEPRSSTLIAQLHSDPRRPDQTTDTFVAQTGFSLPEIPANASLVILLVDGTAGESTPAQELARSLAAMKTRFIVLVDSGPNQAAGQVKAGLGDWRGARVLYGSVEDTAFLLKSFVPAVLDLLYDDHLALGRLFPIFRVEAARRLINETCVSNAAYSISTGLAETVPGLNVPLNVTDMVVLTKAQAFLVYKLGLAFGFSTRWQDYVAEFSSIIGGGFMWRQIARQLVGLIPVWGIVPKVAVAYSGTYVVGNAVMQWYLTGRHITRAQLGGLYREAITRGQAFAKELVRRKPQLRLKGRKAGKDLPAPLVGEPLHGDDEPALEALPAEKLPGNKAASGQLIDLVACPNCGATNPEGADECRSCGGPL